MDLISKPDALMMMLSYGSWLFLFKTLQPYNHSSPCISLKLYKMCLKALDLLSNKASLNLQNIPKEEEKKEIDVETPAFTVLLVLK